MSLPKSDSPVDTQKAGWLPEGLRSLDEVMGLLNGLFDGHPDMVLLVGADGRIAGANSNALTESGYCRRDLEGQPVELLLPMDARERHAGHLRQFMQHPTARAMGSGMDFKVRDCKGNEFKVDIRLWPLTCGGRQFVMAVCHRLETALARTQLQIHALIDTAREHAVNLLDAEGRILTWNEGSRRICNMSGSQALGQHFSILFTPQEIAAGEPDRLLEMASGATKALRSAGWRTGADGESLWIESEFKAIRDPSGKVSGFARVLHDLTRQKRAEEKLLKAHQALSEVEHSFRLLVGSVTDYAIYMLDPQGLVITWNAGAERCKGYTQEEVLGRNFSMFFPAEAVDAGLPAEELATAARSGRYETEGWRVRKDGKRFWALVTLTAIHGLEGALRGFAKVTRDMTTQKSFEEAQARLAMDLEERVKERTRQLELTVSELRSKNEEIEALAAMVSHELSEKEVLLREVYHRVKNNLQVVQSLLRMGARSSRPAEVHTAIEKAVQRVHIMAAVHERLYRLPDLTALSLSDYMRDVIAGAIAAIAENPQQVELQLDVDQIPVSLDLAMPFALLANELVSNCIKHGLPNGRLGKIFVAAKNIQGAVRFVVRDNGIGLPADFDAAKSDSMGLKLASSLAHQLGGRLEFTSVEGCRVQADLTRLAAQKQALAPWQHAPARRS